MSWAQSHLGPTLLGKLGEVATKDALVGKKALGLYFSAHWCPPCRGFTPILSQFYDDLKIVDPNVIEIVFVTSDSDDDSFQSYFASMPWLAIPFGNSEISTLGSSFGVRGIPAFIVVDPETGIVKDPNGRATVQNASGDFTNAVTKWSG